MSRDDDTRTKIFVVLVGCGMCLVGLLAGAWLFTEGGWRGVLTIAGVLAVSTAAQVARLRR